MKKKLYEELAIRVDAVFNCKDRSNTIWEDRHTEMVEYLAETYLPQGSGFDNGTCVLMEKRSEYLHLHTAFHAMDERGGYDGWIDVDVVVKPSLITGFTVLLKGNFGRKHQDLKDYMHEVFDRVLNNEIDPDVEFTNATKHWNKQQSMAN